MKKTLKKEHNDKEDKKERKEREKQEKKEKKEKKKESKKNKKSNHSDSSTSLDSQKSSETVVSKTTTVTSGSPGSEIKTTVVKETVRDNHGERSTMTKIEETPTHARANGETIKKTTTTITKSEPEPVKPVETKTVVKETTRDSPGGKETVVVTKTTSEVQSIPTHARANGETIKKTTTTITKSEPEPVKPVETKTVVKETTRDSPGGKETVVVTKTTSEVQSIPTHARANGETIKKTTTTITKSEPEPVKPVETKTVVKETTRDSPGGKETVVVTKTTSEVQSIPTTREFLDKNFPEEARFERTRHVHNRVLGEDVGPSVDKPSSFSQRTVIREVGDGGHTVKTVTKVVTDEGGTRKTTTSSGGNDDCIVSTDSSRKADFPDWLEKKDDDKRTPKGRATIDDSIKIPSPAMDRKEPPRLEPTGPKVTEEIQPNEQKKEDISNFLDGLARTANEEPKQHNDAAKARSPNSDNQVIEIMNSLESAPKTENGIEFEEDRATEPQKPKEDERSVREKEKEKVIRNGDAVEEGTETYKDKYGKVEKTTTTTKPEKEQKPKKIIDANANILQPEKPKTVQKRREQTQQADDDIFVRDGEEIDPEEVFEEIIVIEKRRKVRFPKSFLPRRPERPRSWIIPLDLLIDRPRRCRSMYHLYGSEIKEEVDETSRDRTADMEELNRVLEAAT